MSAETIKPEPQSPLPVFPCWMNDYALAMAGHLYALKQPPSAPIHHRNKLVERCVIVCNQSHNHKRDRSHNLPEAKISAFMLKKEF
jgi:hypothetical protein